MLVVLGACALAVGIAAACGGTSQSGGSASGPIQVVSQQDIPHTDPAIAYDVLSWPVVHAVFTTLITYDESAEGFVKKEDFGMIDQRPGQRDALGHAAGKMMRIRIRKRFESNQAHEFVHFILFFAQHAARS